jgi:hypothetical protein
MSGGSHDPPPPALAMLASMGYGPQGSGGPEDSYGSHSGASSVQRGGGSSKRTGGTSRLQHSLAPGTHRWVLCL